MKRIFLLMLVLAVLVLVVSACLAEDNDSRILQILNKASYDKDPGIKIMGATFRKMRSDAYWDFWESDIKIKSCYTTRIECTGSGQFDIKDTDNAPVRPSDFPSLGVFPLRIVDKESMGESKGIIKIRKETVNRLDSFYIDIKCNPVYQDHSNKYPPNHKYWKQFLPKNNSCK